MIRFLSLIPFFGAIPRCVIPCRSIVGRAGSVEFRNYYCYLACTTDIYLRTRAGRGTLKNYKLGIISPSSDIYDMGVGSASQFAAAKRWVMAIWRLHYMDLLLASNHSQASLHFYKQLQYIFWKSFLLCCTFPLLLVATVYAVVETSFMWTIIYAISRWRHPE